MQRFTRREFLTLSAATAAGLTLAACQPIQPPTPAAQEAAPRAPAVPPLEEVSLLDAEAQAAIEHAAQVVVDESGVPGLAVGITQADQVAYAEGFGVSRIGTDQPVTPRSVFQVMDLTHLFTATAAMQLVEQGKLDLDTPIVEYIPYFKLADDRYKQVTMRHLLSESAGLPATQQSNPAEDWEGKTPQTDDEALERYVRSLSDTDLSITPGLMSTFCNMGYDIAGDVIAKVSGQVFEEYMHQHILERLGMAQSTFYPEQVDPKLRVTPHVREGADVVVSELVTWSRERAPSMGLFSNLVDLLRWTQANLNRGELESQRILQESSYDDELWRPQFVGAGPSESRNVGLGWYLGANTGHPICHYTGTDLGFHCEDYLAPEDSTGVVVLGNLFTSMDSTPFYAFTIAQSAFAATTLR